MVTETFSSLAFASAAATMTLILARSRYFLLGRSAAEAAITGRRIAARNRFTNSSCKNCAFQFTRGLGGAYLNKRTTNGVGGWPIYLKPANVLGAPFMTQ